VLQSNVVEIIEVVNVLRTGHAKQNRRNNGVS